MTQLISMYTINKHSKQCILLHGVIPSELKSTVNMRQETFLTASEINKIMKYIQFEG